MATQSHSFLAKEYAFLHVQLPYARNSKNAVKQELYTTLECLLNHPTWSNIELYFLTKRIYLQMTDYSA